MTDNTFLKKLSRTFFAGLVACLFIGAATNAAHAACATNEIDVLGDGTQCETSKFEVTTTNLAANDTIIFSLSAGGTFYVDCGDGGSLSQETSSGNTTSGMVVTRGNTTSTQYTCTWDTAGAHTVRFGGTATGYSTSTSTAAISFYKSSSGTQARVASIDGSLGAMFPVINGTIPMFFHTFDGTQITSIPSGLFDTINTSSLTNTSYMFQGTFYGCTSLQSIPSGLFDSINTSSATNTTYMFYSTFYNCTSLNTIPSGLFDAIDTSSSTNTSNMFYSTFYGTKITSIPTGLFSSINTSSATNTSSMFGGTFSSTQITSIPTGLFNGINTSSATSTSNMFDGTFGNTKITSIPANLFGTINTSSATSTSYMFNGTFAGTQITSIPENLFSTINTSSATSTRSMFSSTFSNTKITSIPSDLFSTINTSSATNTSSMFTSTFSSCTSLTSISSGLFDAINTSSSTNTSYMFQNTFYGTQITSIPSGLFDAIDTSSATNTSHMFNGTFDNCTSLTGYIPPTAFPNTIRPGSSSSSNMWYLTFNRTQLATTCPAGTVEYNTGFQNDWGYSKGNTTTSGTYRVSCEQCGSGYYVNNNTCTSCATLGDGSYTNSNAGSASATDCYKACTTADFPHSTTVTGNDYYGTTTDSCDVTACETGYHIQNLTSIIGSSVDYVSGMSGHSAYISNSGTNTYGNLASYGLTENGTFAIQYQDNNGTIKGRSQCSSQRGTGYLDGATTPEAISLSATLPNSSGAYCWCTVDEYTPVGGSPISLSGPWVYWSLGGMNSTICSNGCASNCVDALRNNHGNRLTFRVAVLNSRIPRLASCEPNSYTLNPGQYLPAASETPTQCPAGSFCPGGTVYYDANNDQGITSCSTVGDGSYTNSNAGSTSATDCYKTCAATDDPHANLVSSVGYYGTGCNYECDSGYYMNSNICTSCATLGDGSYTNSNTGSTSATQCYKACTTAAVSHSAAVTGNDYYGMAFSTCSATSCENGYHKTPVSIGDTSYNRYGYRTGNGGSSSDASYFNLSSNGEFAVEYQDNRGTVRGRAQCSTQSGTNGGSDSSAYTTRTTLPNSSGQHCYCRADSYTPVDGAPMSLSGSWVYYTTSGSSNSCANYCASNCADQMLYTDTYRLAFRRAVLSAMPQMCEITEIWLYGGEYLPAGSETKTTCPAGSYCPSNYDEPYYYDANNDQGIIACSTLAGGAYPNSDTYSSYESDCYHVCTVADVNVSHVATTSGNYYYNMGDSQCPVESCEAGYHIDATAVGAAAGTHDGNIAYISNNGNSNANYTVDSNALSENGTFAVEYYTGDWEDGINPIGTIYGRAQCSTRAGAGNTWVQNDQGYMVYQNIASNKTNTLPNASGPNCYCMVDNYIPVDGTSQSLSTQWLFAKEFSWDEDYGDASETCINYCAGYCAETLSAGAYAYYNMPFREALLGSPLPSCELSVYTIEPGYYLPAASETPTPTPCPAGSFCPGLPNPVTANANNAQGITSCSTLGDHSYTNSAVGASANSDCYKLCTSENVPHATVITGKDYYGDGTDTCSATSCENGYHTYAISAAVPLTSEIGNTGGRYWALGNDGYDDYGSGVLAAHGVTQNGTFTVWYWGNNDDPNNDPEPTGARITGRSQCSTRAGAGGENTWIENTETGNYDYQNLPANITDTLPDNSGTNCYCTMDGYAPAGGATQSVSNPWVSPGFDYDTDECARWCAEDCGYMFEDGESYNMPFREIFMITGSTAACTGNTITVNWSNASAADIAANTAGTVTYGGDIRTPRAATIIPGKVFLGWKFSRPGA